MTNLPQAWLAAWRRQPQHAALVDPVSGMSWSAEELEESTRTAALQLAAAGVGAGDRVLLSCAPSPQTIISYIAIMRLGATVVPANTDYTATELTHILSTALPVLAVIDDPSRVGNQCRAVGADLHGLAQRSHDVTLDEALPEDPAMWGFTSGTTGKPKAAILTHANLLAGSQSVIEAWEWTPDDTLLHVLPMFHMHGLGVGLNGALTAGSTITVLPKFDPKEVALAASESTMFFGVPTMYARMADTGTLTSLREQRLLVSGSAPLPTDFFAAIYTATGQAPLERYGMTETVMLTGNPLHGERRAGSVGVSMPGVDVRLGEGDVVEVRGPNVFRGYVNVDPVEVFTDDGWFPTGDIGSFDDDGYLRLVGRASELIITGGYNVYPREVEDVIRQHPGVLDVAVIGRPSREWGEVVTAVIVGDVGTQEIESISASALAPYKRPRAFEFVQELPRNAMGKIDRSQL